jgi:hypothetical protein
MANWAYVEENEIKELHDLLPKSWRNISGLRLLENNTEFLNSIGWYSVIKQHQSYDKSSYQTDGYNYVFDEKRVIETIKLIEYQENLEQQLISFDQQKINFLFLLREERNRRLINSDWSQLLDTQEFFNDDERIEWKKYRQYLRDLTDIYVNDSTIDLELVNWPVIPLKNDILEESNDTN